MISRLNNDRKIKSLVAQFVPLKVETIGDDWQVWATKYEVQGDGIPYIYVIRADGEQLYGKSGAIHGEELPKFMKEHLKTAGRVFPVANAKKLQTLVDKAKESYEQGDMVATVKTLKPLMKVGKLGELGSHAKPALEADEFVTTLLEECRKDMKEASERLSEDSEDVEAAVKLAFISRVYMPLIKSEIVGVMQKHRRDSETKELIKEAEAIDKVNVKLKQRNGQKLAATALQGIMARNANTPVFEYVQENYEEMIGEPLDDEFLSQFDGETGGADAESSSLAENSSSDSAGDDEADTTQDAEAEADLVFGATPAPSGPEAAGLGMRIWKTRDGKHEIEAEFVKLMGKKVRLRKKNGKTTTVAIKILSDEDRQLLKE